MSNAMMIKKLKYFPDVCMDKQRFKNNGLLQRREIFQGERHEWMERRAEGWSARVELADPP